MKITQNRVLPAKRQAEIALVASLLARLRIARHMTQAEAAVRAGLSRNTAYRLEKGDAGLAIGQVLRYLEAIAPGKTLLSLLLEDDPALAALEAGEKRQRASTEQQGTGSAGFLGRARWRQCGNSWCSLRWMANSRPPAC